MQPSAGLYLMLAILLGFAGGAAVMGSRLLAGQGRCGPGVKGVGAVGGVLLLFACGVLAAAVAVALGNH